MGMVSSLRVAVAVFASSFMIGALACSGARCADKPEIGPPEAWVKPPPKTPEPLKASAGAALASLVQDNQIRFASQGLDVYQALEVKVQSPQGLQALNTFSLAWSPETDRLTVHRIRILRGDQFIDVLPKDGVFTIARREEKLDSEGQLDGILTAIVNIDGLQVGDIIDLAYTVHRKDLLFKNRVDQVSAIPDVLPIAYSRIRISWPTSQPVRWGVSGGMPAPQVIRRDGMTEAELVLEGVKPLIMPQGAPPRFQRGRELSVTSYGGWSDVSAAMAPLFAAAVQLKPDSPLKAEAAAIAARTADPELRAAAALSLVQDKIRYLAQVLGEGGYKPASADDTWVRRYGDCKAKTALLIALLSALGIKAEPALVSTNLGSDLDTRLPSLGVFNHVFVHATIGEHDYWLDGTRSGDLSLAALETPNFGFVLPVRTSAAALVRLRPQPLQRPRVSNLVRIDASKGIDQPSPAHVEVTLRGDGATVMRVAIANLTPEALDRALRDYWRQNYEYIEVSSTKAAYNPVTAEETLVMDGEAKLDWSGGYEPDGASLGWKFDITRDPDAVHPDAPFSVAFPTYVEQDDTLILPDHGRNFTIWGEQVDRELAGEVFYRKAVIENGVFHLRTSVRSLVPEIGFIQAKVDAPLVTAMGKTTLKLMAPQGSAATSLDPTSLGAKTPTDATGFIARGNRLLDSGRYREAMEDFGRALKLEPKSAVALADRALAHVWLGQTKLALEDADQAEALNPREPLIYRARGLAAERAADWPEALANFTRSVDLAPDAFGYLHRALAYMMTKDYVRALRDVDAALAIQPTLVSAHLAKAEVYIQMKQLDQARSEVDAVKAAARDQPALEARRLSVLLELGDRKTARAEIDAALAAQPTPVGYLMRIGVREEDDREGREADAKAAYALDPKNLQALRTVTAYRLRAKDYPGATAWADKALALKPDDPVTLAYRAEARLKLGQLDAARSDFGAVRAAAKGNAGLLNTLCWNQAIGNLDLNKALADCDASLALVASPNALDSRAFVLLRLGRNLDAKASYDAALAKRPDSADSLYGRSLAERRLGDAQSADKDKAAAAAKEPKIADTYADYGVKP